MQAAQQAMQARAGMDATLLLLLLLPAAATAAPPSRRPRPQVLLFVDRHHINASDSRLALHMQQPTKGPWVLVQDKPWEAWSIGGYNTVIAGDGTRPHRLYYACNARGPPERPWGAPQRVCLAESHDGEKWVKPLLGLYTFNGSKQNNILVGAEGCTPFIEPPSHAVPASERWKMVCSNGEGTPGQAWSGPDGLRWRPLPDSKDLTFSDDTQPTVQWDAALEKYVIFVRRDVGPHDAGNRRRLGRCITANLSDWQQDSTRQTCDGTGPKPCGCEIVFGPDAKDPPNLDIYTNAHLPYPSVEDPAVHLFFPSFFSHFTGNDKHSGPPNNRSNDGLLDTRLLVAHRSDGNLSYAADGSRAPFVPLGINRCNGWTPSRTGGWCSPDDGSQSRTSRDTSTTWMAQGYIPSADGEQLQMYYTGTPYTHAGGADLKHSWGDNTGIGRLALRLDGFVALEAPYDFSNPRPAFTTNPVLVPTSCAAAEPPQLLVNMIAGVAGYVAVAVEPADGQPLPPGGAVFNMAHANHLKGNAIRAVASWAPQQGQDESGDDGRAVVDSLAPLAGRSVVLRVEMVDAKLFSLRLACAGAAAAP